MARSRPALAVVLVLFAIGIAWLLLRDRGAAPTGPRGADFNDSAAPSSDLATPVEPPSFERASADRTTHSTLAESPASTAACLRVLVADPGGNPIAGARVRVVAGAAPVETVSQFDGVGWLLLPKVEEEFELRVEADGYLPVCHWVEWNDEIEIRLGRSGSVRGVVRDRDTGVPIPGASVALQETLGRCPEYADSPAVTDRIGRFELAGVPRPTGVAFVARAEGYKTWRRTITIVEGEQPGPLEIDLEPGVAIAFEVVDLTAGLGLPGSSVSFEGETLRTDEQGRLTTTSWLGRDDEVLNLRIEAEGHCVVRAKLKPPPQGDPSPVRLALPAYAYLEGVVTDAEGKPIQGAWVSPVVAWNENSRAWMNGTRTELPEQRLGLPEGWDLVGGEYDGGRVTDAEGRFRSQGFIPWIGLAEIRCGEHDYEDSREIVGPLGGPGSTLPVEIVLRRKRPASFGSIEFRLTLNGKPLGGDVGWRTATRSSFRHLEGGTTVFEEVEAGTVSLIFECPFSEDCALGRELPEEAEVRSGERTLVEIALELPTAVISGRVADPGGIPVPGVHVRADSPGACLGGVTTTDEEGDWSLEVGSEVTAYTVSWQLRDEIIERAGVAPGKSDVDLVVKRTGTLRCQILCSDTGKPPAMAGLMWRRSGSEHFRNLRLHGTFPSPDTAPDTAGWFQFEVPGGPIEVIAVLDARSDYLPSELVAVTILPDGQPAQVALVLPRGHELHIQLAEGAELWPQEILAVLVEDSLWDELWIERSNSGGLLWNWELTHPGIGFGSSRSVRAALSEQRPIRKLAPGRYRFKVVPPVISIEPESIEVSGNETEPIELRWSWN